MQVSVHGGTHKTGTTAVQHVLELNRTRLAEAGVFVPAVSHHDLLSAKRPGWSPAGCLQVIEDARKNGFEHIVLSGETVSTFSFDQFRNLSACFEELDLTYVFCFRHWSTHLSSRWAQNSVRRDSQTFGSYLGQIGRSDWTHPDCRFDIVLDRAAASGAARVSAISYEHAMMSDGDVVPTVLRALGIGEATVLGLEAMPRLNARADPMLVEACRLLNGLAAERAGLPQDDLCRALGEYRPCRGFFDLSESVQNLPPDALDPLDRMLATSQQRFALIDFQTVGYRLDHIHRRKFLNPHDGHVMPQLPPTEIGYCDLQWQDCRSLLSDIAEQIGNWGFVG